MSKTTNIVILGAGYAGVHAAKKLAKKYKKNDNVQITLIDKNPFHTLMTELHEVAGGRVHEESVKVELSEIFHRTKVNVVVDYIENVDMEAQKVKTKFGEYTYDYLMVGMGNEPAYFGVPGVKENGFSLWSLEDALKIREHIEHKFKVASLERDAAKRKEMLTFVVAGSGFTGIEMAGELLEWKSTLAREYRVDENEVSLLVVEAAGTILNMLDRKQADKAEKYMVKHGMKILKDSPITEVKADEITLKSGEVIRTQTLIWTCGIQNNQDCVNMGLETARAGRLQANKYMQSTKYENVYLVGDCAYVEEEPGKGNPQIVEAAEQTAATAAKNIIASIENKEKVEFKSSYHGFMVSIGGKYCVANLMGIKLSGLFAMLAKHFVNMIYLFGILNIPQVYRYLQHEFFGIKENRNILRGHLASKGNRLWLIPLRLYVGCLWLLEGLAKLCGESTWETAVDALFNKGQWLFTIGTDSWIKAGNINMPFSWLQDGVTGASAAVEGAAEAATPILSSMPGFYESIMKIMIPNEGMAQIFQIMVVALEIGIGLALIVGLFTFLAGAASAFMTVNFILSAMAGWDILWYTCAGIALMSGAGRTFGLDYYVMPWITKVASNWWLGKRKHIYSNN